MKKRAEITAVNEPVHYREKETLPLREQGAPDAAAGIEGLQGKISVLMGIYNCEATLEAAIASITAQTYPNWELILCDDGSTDGTARIVEQAAVADPRIIILKNETNCGLNTTLNRCFRAATGEYIARMDGDDDCLPERFEKELRLLQENSDIAIVSTPMILFDEHGEWGKTTIPEYPTPEQVVTGTPISHAPVMIRREAMEAVGGYTEDPRMLRVEDVNLWIKLYTAGYRCRNLQEPLYRMRNDRNALQRRKYRYRINSTYVRLKGCQALGLSAGCYVKAFSPMVHGLVPAGLRSWIRRRQQKQ